ncbi:MAG: phosphatidate cytidylyltransferase [Actinobacteria bacterium]|nr:phosphatidate cytidylyltransferase [Actinomycetota bacterium]
MSQLVSRLLVGAALLPIVLGVSWLGGWWLFAVVLLASLVALHELYTMTRGQRPLVLAGYVGLVVLLLGVELGGIGWLGAGPLATVLVAFVLYGIADARPSAAAAFGTTLLGVVWVGGGLAHVILLRDIEEHGRTLVFAVALAVFAGDTAAYFVGRAIGRHRLAPTISPKKSWEGFIAGTLASVVVTFFALYEDRETYLAIWESLVLGLAVAIAAVLGDLFESAVKRDVGVKDSGRLLGGHGGMLDRLDSLLWAVPAAYYVTLALT